MLEQLTIDDHIAAASDAELMRWFDKEDVPDWARTSVLFDTKVTGALSRRGSSGVEFLKGRIESSNQHTRYLVLSALSNKGIADDVVVRHLVRAFRG